MGEVLDHPTRSRARDELIWFDIELASGTWTAFGVDAQTGEVRFQAFDVVRERCWEKAQRRAAA
jgi:hypothetical protein